MLHQNDNTAILYITNWAIFQMNNFDNEAHRRQSIRNFYT